MDTIDISSVSLLFAFLLLTVPLLLSHFFGLGLVKPLFISVARMSIQLFLIGVFLKYLFLWNHAAINLVWLAVMIVVAVFSAIRNSEIRLSKVLGPVFVSFSAATYLIVLYLNSFVVKLDYVFDARYLIVLGGMLLGNSLRGNIIGIDSFYRNIRRDTKKFLYVLSLGAGRHEALLPYVRESTLLALKPTLASMATMGIVALPGVMTGVILGGTSPEVAVKYQIVIMIAIVVSTIGSVMMTILMTLRVCFTKYGTLRTDIFVDRGS